MWPFRNYGIEPKPEIPPIKNCDHKWTDIRDNDGNELWYIDYGIENGTLKYKIVEPYICIHCKDRRDITLEEDTWIFHNFDQCIEKVEELYKQYPQIKARAVVEDAVNDFRLIDRDYLSIATTVMGVKI